MKRKSKIQDTDVEHISLLQSSSLAEGNGKYVVIKDTREKEGQGWRFGETEQCAGMVRATLATGDYTLVGYEGVLCIERKGCVAEFAKNVCQARFWKELERMRQFPVAALILEFREVDILNWPVGSGIPKSRWKYIRLTKKFILSRLHKIREDYPNIRVILAAGQGEAVARSLFKEVTEKYAAQLK